MVVYVCAYILLFFYLLVHVILLQSTVNETVSDFLFRYVNACICMCIYFTIFYLLVCYQSTVNKTVSDFFFRYVNVCICMCTYFTIFLGTGLIQVYLITYSCG